MKVVSNLKSIMKNKGMSYDDIQYLCSVSPDTIARASDQRILSCSLKTLSKFAEALEVQISELYTEEKDG